jgi:hypothetical protein
MLLVCLSLGFQGAKRFEDKISYTPQSNQANGKSLRDYLQDALDSTNVAADEAHFLEKQ